MVALVAAVMCVGGVAAARASTVEERVAGLYANPEAIASLREGIIPQGWEHAILPEQDWDVGEFRSLFCIEDTLSWTLLFETDESGSSGRLIYTDLEMWHPFEEQNSLRFTMYEGLTEQDARFTYICSSNNFNWSVVIPREVCLETLTEFVALAAFCGHPMEERTDDELAIRKSEIESFLHRWREKYAILSEHFWSPWYNYRVFAGYKNEMYTLDIDSDYECLSYTLSEAQYKAIVDAHAQLTSEEWSTYAVEFAAALRRAPDRVLSLGSDEQMGPFLIGYLSNSKFQLFVYYEETDFYDILELEQATYEVLAAECLPLSPAERTVHLNEAYERLRAEND
ncbi:MAG: hypothetical protein FWE77_00235 [Clostridia bacterium]|nr:hypothetical protein [Clostridia bacterium]